MMTTAMPIVTMNMKMVMNVLIPAIKMIVMSMML